MVAIVRAVIPGSSQHAGRYLATRPVNVAEGWSLRRLTPPSRLFGANGLRTGPDGRVYIAQVTGSQISALDLATGELDTVSAKGGDIIAPDDVAFDPDGNLYATEVMDGRVSMRDADGPTPGCCATTYRPPTASPFTGAGCSSASAGRADACWNSISRVARRGCCWRTRRLPTPWRLGPTGCCTSR